MRASKPSMYATTPSLFTLITNGVTRIQAWLRKTSSCASTTNAMVSLGQTLALRNCQNFSHATPVAIRTRSPLSEFHQQTTQQYDLAEPASAHRDSGAGRYDEWLWF